MTETREAPTPREPREDETPGTPLSPEEEAAIRRDLRPDDQYQYGGWAHVVARLLATLDRERRERVDRDLRAVDVPTALLRLEWPPSDGLKPGDARFDAVLASVREYRVRNPLAIKADWSVIDGAHRLCAARILGLDTVPVVIWTGREWLPGEPVRGDPEFPPLASTPDHTECGEGRDIEIERQTARMHSYCVNDCEVGADGRRTFRNNAFEDEECIDSIHSAADGLAALARATPRPR